MRKLLAVLHALVERGNTVIVIEHNLDVVKTADRIVDLGPEGGARGGLVIAEGTPEEVGRGGGDGGPRRRAACRLAPRSGCCGRRPLPRGGAGRSGSRSGR